MKLRSCFAVALAAVLAGGAIGCGDIVLPTEPDGGDGTSGADGGARSIVTTEAGSPDVIEPSSLRLVQYGVSSSTLSDSGKITFHATVSDAKVPLANIRAELTDDTGASYGALTANGTFDFTRTLDWMAINKVRPIVVSNGVATRTFIVSFYALGEVASGALTITLACPVDRPAACGAFCQISCP